MNDNLFHMAPSFCLYFRRITKYKKLTFIKSSLVGIAKDQLISKGFFGVLNSSKKRTKTIRRDVSW